MNEDEALDGEIFQQWRNELENFITTNIAEVVSETRDVVGLAHRTICETFEKYDKEQIAQLEFTKVKQLKNIHEIYNNNTSDSLLIGVLANNGSSKRHLYLYQNASYILVHFISIDPVWNNKLVILPKWKCVKLESIKFLPQVYVEADEDPIIICDVDETIPSTLQSSLREKAIATVSGVVDSCMPASGTSKKLPFFVRLRRRKSGYYDVMMNNVEFAYWRFCLKKGSEVCFENVQPSKLKLVNYPQAEILQALPETRLHVSKPSSLFKNDLPVMTCKDLANLANEYCLNKRDSKCTNHPICPSFIGKVMEVTDETLGIYSLEGNVFLVCTFIPCEDMNYGIRPGAILLIERAHLFEVDGLYGLVCCSRSSVDILRHSELMSPFKFCLVRFNILVDKPEFQTIHPFRLIHLKSIKEQLIEKLPFLQYANLNCFVCQDELPNVAPNILLTLAQDYTKRVTRCCLCSDNDTECSHLSTGCRDDIFSEPHCCRVQKILHCDATNITTCTLETIINAVAEITELNESFNQSTSPDYWSYQAITSQAILSFLNLSKSSTRFVFSLNTNKETGHLQLTDGQNAIDCLLVDKITSENPKVFTQSERSLCLADRCAVILVLKFTCVTELELKENGEFSRSKYCIVAMDDIKLLKRAKGSGPEVKNKFGCSNRDVVSLINNKKSMDASKRIRKAHHTVTKSSFNAKDVSDNAVKYFFITQQHKMQDGKSDKSPTCNISACHLEDDKFTEVHLRLTAKSIKWLPFLTPGLFVKVDENVINICPEVQESCQFSGVYFVPDNCDIHHVHNINELKQFECLNAVCDMWLASSYRKFSYKYYTVKELCKNSQKQRMKIVSIAGKITSRISFKDSVGFEKLICYRVELSDMTSLNFDMTVYFNNIKFDLLHGLLPGAVVKLQGVQLFISRKGKVYCKYLPSSKLQVLQMVTDAFVEQENDKIINEKNNSINSSINLNQEISNYDQPSTSNEPISNASSLEKTYITQLYGGLAKHKSSSVFKITGSIVQVFTLKIAFKCKKCNKPPFSFLHKNTTCFTREIFQNSELMQRHIKMDFMAKCTLCDSTGVIYLHFDSSTAAAFATMIGWSKDLLKQVYKFVMETEKGFVIINFNFDQNDKRRDDQVTAMLKVLLEKVNGQVNEKLTMMVRVLEGDTRTNDASTEDFVESSRYALGQIKTDNGKTLYKLYQKTLNAAFHSLLK